MNNSPETYEVLANIILHWWQAIALSFTVMGLIIVFFFTMHKGIWYRAAFMLLLIIGICYVYALLLQKPQGSPGPSDLLLPLLFTSWAFVTWARASLLMKSFKRHRGALKVMAENDFSSETDWIPYVETSLFAERMERWQKWLYAMIAGAFASGILYNNVANLETLLWAYLRSNQKVVAQSVEAKQSRDSIAYALNKKNIQDSLWHAFIRNDQEKQLQAINNLKQDIKKQPRSSGSTGRPAIIIVSPSAKSVPASSFRLPELKPLPVDARPKRRGKGYGYDFDYSELDSTYLARMW